MIIGIICIVSIYVVLSIGVIVTASKVQKLECDYWELDTDLNNLEVDQSKLVENLVKVAKHFDFEKIKILEQIKRIDECQSDIDTQILGLMAIKGINKNKEGVKKGVKQ